MTDTAADTSTLTGTDDDTTVEHVDVLIVGAGISGIGAAYHLRTQRPGTTFAVLDAHPAPGGTWWTHRYPGIRSDSDLFTFGYRFKPWTGTPIATGEEILKYLNEVIEENDLGGAIRYEHRVEAAASMAAKDVGWLEVAVNDAGLVREVVMPLQAFVKEPRGRAVGGSGQRGRSGGPGNDLCAEVVDRHDGSTSYSNKSTSARRISAPSKEFIFLGTGNSQEISGYCD